ncbi:MAG: S4 domain-containing protein, partial [Flavobacteriaceae bacterium]
MRINKYLSQIGICSRREADKLVDSGRIKVNDEIAILGTKIKEGDKITIDNKLIKPKKKNTILIAFNK